MDAQTSIDIGNNVSAPIGIGTNGNTTTIKGHLIVDGNLTLNNPASGNVNADTLNVSEVKLLLSSSSVLVLKKNQSTGGADSYPNKLAQFWRREMFTV